ncbi:hypothetical protein GGF41_005361 [Coemansia sp. RSA 2531]|nr:hypothetical protein GGF41_005361 [Coemansia sp. RSA 2531]
MSYPVESQKGKYISIFWVIFNLGGVIGGIVPFVVNYSQGKGNIATPLPDSCYAAFVGLQALGSLSALCLAPPQRVIRDDGSHVVLMRYTNVKYELMEVLKLFVNPWILLLIPISLASNFFYTYQYGPYNGALFTLRTRGLNSMLYWAAQMAAAYAVSFLHDRESLSRKQRGLLSLGLMALLCNAMWALTMVMQLRYTRGADDKNPSNDYPGGLIDLTEPGRAVGPILLYIFMGAVDAHVQSFAYWLIGTMTNDSQMLARYAGFYKGIQSLGATIAWQLDAQNVSLMGQVIVNWVLIVVALPFTYYVTSRIKDHAEDSIEQPADDWLMRADGGKSDYI